MNITHKVRKSNYSTKKRSHKKTLLSRVSINGRLDFIKTILDGQKKITLSDFNYPYQVSNNNSLSIPLVKNKPCDTLQYFNQDGREKKILVDKHGDLLGIVGVPYLLCNGKCSNQESFKLGVKMMLFNVDDLRKYLLPNEVLDTVLNSLKKKVNIDLLKINTRDPNHLTDEQFYEIYGVSDNELPQNSEIKMIYELSKLVLLRQTPHINLPVMAFQCHLKDFIKKASETEKGIFKSQNHVRNTNLVNILISEWCNGGSLEIFLTKNIDLFNSSPKYLDILFFQLLSLLTTIHRSYPYFRHNDLHLGNILVDTCPPDNKYYLYQIKNINNPGKYTNYLIPNLGFQIRLWDYDLSSIDGIVNNKTVLQAEYEDCEILSQGKNQFFDLVKFFFILERDFVVDYNLNVSRYKEMIYKDILGDLNYIFYEKKRKNKNMKDKQIYDISLSGCLNLDIEKITPEELLRKYSSPPGFLSNYIIDDSQLSKFTIIEQFKV